MSDILPDLLTRFRSLLGFTTSDAKLKARGYSREYELASQQVTAKDLDDRVMQAPGVVELLQEAMLLPGFLMYVCSTPRVQGLSNLALTGQMKQGENREYMAFKDAHPGQLPPIPETLRKIFSKIKAKGEEPRYNTNAGNARDFAAMRPAEPHAERVALTAAQADVRESVLGLGGNRDIRMAVVISEGLSGAGSLFSIMTPR
jgi:hypothetical protein